MKTILHSLLITVCLTTFGFAQQSESRINETVKFVDLKSEYQNLADLKPSLKNFSDQSIFLFWYYPLKVQILRLNEETKEWEIGREGYACATNMIGTGNYGPLEIKPQSAFPIYWEWNVAFDRSKQFVLKDWESRRPQKGKYKLKIPYSFEEWKLTNSPKVIHEIESEEFFINPN